MAAKKPILTCDQQNTITRRNGMFALWFIAFAILALAFSVLSVRPAKGADLPLYTVVVKDPAQTIEAAQAHAKLVKEPCFFLLGAEWCGPCREVERLYGPVLQRRGTYLHLDIEKHRPLVRRLGVDIARVPVLVVIDAAKGVRRVLVGPQAIRLYIEGH